ncbi:upstream stimulatory factor 1-like isoform X2 [Bacillus rossius redtenbacheri]|uniref:upstream stimulatory factor 1-like isoform X2 n=1 Tax=Bacillus rossius redtenbacheri TaxID=93214 RepID=UPI002FDDB490
MDMLDHSLENSQDRDGDASDGSCLGADSKELVTQSLTIVEDDGSLGSAEDQSTVAELARTQALLEDDGDVQYQFRSSDGGFVCRPRRPGQVIWECRTPVACATETVTYRVVQVGGADSVEPLSQIVSSSSGFTGTGVQQAVLASPINGGQFYVINPQDVFGSAASRSAIQIEPSRGSGTRDDRRRATHNEVERRRRDKINNWILKLSKIIPDCTAESAKSAQVSTEEQSKGGILAKACEYIIDLRASNQRLAERVKHSEQVVLDNEMLRQQNEKLERTNSLLIAQLRQHGIVLDVSSVS